MTKSIVVFVTLIGLAGCSGIPDRNVPEGIQQSLPLQYDKNISMAAGVIANDWWRAFDDPFLIRLVEQGVERNSDLIIAAARLQEARAVYRQNRASQFPTIGVFAGGGKQRTMVSGIGVTGESANYGGSVSYEVDLWGRLASTSEAARQRYLSESYTLETLKLSIVAELIRGYLETGSLIQSRHVLEENVTILEDALRLNQRRETLGFISRLDVERARAELEDTRAQLASVMDQQAASERALLVLAGEMPTRDAVSSFQVVGPGVDVVKLPVVAAGIPSELLEKRPDLRAAEASLAGAKADVGAAKRALFPNITLTGTAGQASSDLSNLFSNTVNIWSLGVDLVATIFDGGQRLSVIDAARARREQLVENYRYNVRNAFREVLDSLDTRSYATSIYESRAAQADALRTALHLAERRYEEGQSDYLSVLDARRGLLSARLAMIQARRDAGIAWVDLNLALGGGWSGAIE